MSATAWKLEKDLCRCCHSDGAFQSLYSPYRSNNEEIVYSNKLWECFNIELTPVTEPGNRVCAICDACIQRLRDAIEFKHQVLECERKFQEMYLSRINKDFFIQIDIKEELPDPEDNNFAFVGCHSAVNDDLDSMIPDDGRTADDGANSASGRDADSKIEDGEEGNQKAKRRRTKKVSVKVKKKNVANDSHPKKKKVSRPKKISPPETEEAAESDPEKSKTRLRRPATRLKEGIDYKFDGDEFHCCRCENVHKTMRRLRGHIMYVHLRIPRYHCRVCFKLFRSSSSFISHKLKVHNIDNRFKCNACDKVFTSKTQLKSHMNSFHKLGVKRKCDDCDYESFSGISLRRHKVVHESEKVYHCAHCSKTFKRNNALRLHEKIHTGVKGKVCKECGQAFVQKASLNYHMSKHHPGVNF